MRDRAQRPGGRRDRPSTKPLLVVALLLVAASTAAAITTSSVPAPARHGKPAEQIVVTAVTRGRPGPSLNQSSSS
jgi:hypothetical protein